MKKLFSLVLIATTIFGLLNSTQPVYAEACYGMEMYADISFNPTSVEPGQEVVLTVVITNCTYKESYEPDDTILDNVKVEVQNGISNQYLIPSSDWVVYEGSMEDTPTITKSTTYTITEDASAGNFGGFSVVRWLDKDDPETFDHVMQDNPPLEILATQQEQTEEPQVEEEEEADDTQNSEEETGLVTLPGSLIAEDATTTRIDEMTCEELTSLDSFVLEVTGKNKVVFDQDFDFCDDEILEKLNNLSKYIDLSTTAKVMIDTSYLDFFQAPATITMYNLTFDTRPVIYKDDQIATTEDVSNVSYDAENGILTFDVETFSTYEARAQKSSNQGEIAPGKNPIQNSPLVLLLFLYAVIVIGGIGFSCIYKKKTDKKTTKDKKEEDKKSKDNKLPHKKDKS